MRFTYASTRHWTAAGPVAVQCSLLPGADVVGTGHDGVHPMCCDDQAGLRLTVFLAEDRDTR
jgi:hypothetical protein